MKRTYLAVPFEKKDEAKRLGARWNPKCRQWYVDEPVDLEPFSQWIANRGRTVNQAKKSPANRKLAAEFSDAAVNRKLNRLV